MSASPKALASFGGTALPIIRLTAERLSLWSGDQNS